MRSVIVFLCLIAIGSTSLADPVFRPLGLEDGDQYRLLFPTSRWTNARSSEIQFYNEFVQDVADTAPIVGDWGLEWKALISTAEVSAAENTQTHRHLPSVPIYRLDGQLIIPSYRALWVDELGNYQDNDVAIPNWNLNDRMRRNPRFLDGSLAGAWTWTGTDLDGSPIGPAGSASGSSVVGDADLDSGEAIRKGGINSGVILPIYAVSEVITVPVAGPGDANEDGTVDFSDFLILSENFGGEGTRMQGDFTGDGFIRFEDFLILSVNFEGNTEGASVPEPATAGLAIIALVGLVLVRQRRSPG